MNEKQQKEALDDLAAAIRRCRQVGIGIWMAPLYGAVRTSMIIALEQVEWINGRLELCKPEQDADV